MVVKRPVVKICKLARNFVSIRRLTCFLSAVLIILPCLPFGTAFGQSTSEPKETDSPSDTVSVAANDSSLFTSEVLPVLYVKDVVKSVEFYRDKLGFEFRSYHDYETNSSVTEWTKSSPAIYAEFRAGDQRFALHLPSNPDSLCVGGAIHYFGVKDVRHHHQLLKERGVKVSEIKEPPWMTLFRVIDPDGHYIFFFTRPE